MGLHSSDPATVFLSVRARVDDIKTEDIESALYDTAEVVRMWAMRRTMFVVRPELGRIMYAAAGRNVVADERRKLLKMINASHDLPDPEGWVAAASEAAVEYLAAVGSASTAEMRRNVPGLDRTLVVQQGNQPEVSMSMASRLLMLLAMDGRIVKGRPAGTWRSSQYEWVSVAAWGGEPIDLPTEGDPEAELVRRWLHTYGPGTFEDVKWWTGWTRAKTRQALLGAGATEVALDEGSGWGLVGDTDCGPEPEPWVALLPGLDSTVMGWKERGWFLGDLADRLFDRNGNAGPTVWVDGRVVGAWAQRPDGSVAVGLLDDVGQAAGLLVEREAERLAEWVGPVGLRSRFPSPLEKELRSS